MNRKLVWMTSCFVTAVTSQIGVLSHGTPGLLEEETTASASSSVPIQREAQPMEASQESSFDFLYSELKELYPDKSEDLQEFQSLWENRFTAESPSPKNQVIEDNIRRMTEKALALLDMSPEELNRRTSVGTTQQAVLGSLYLFKDSNEEASKYKGAIIHELWNWDSYYKPDTLRIAKDLFAKATAWDCPNLLPTLHELQEKPYFHALIKDTHRLLSYGDPDKVRGIEFIITALDGLYQQVERERESTTRGLSSPISDTYVEDVLQASIQLGEHNLDRILEILYGFNSRSINSDNHDANIPIIGAHAGALIINRSSGYDGDMGKIIHALRDIPEEFCQQVIEKVKADEALHTFSISTISLIRDTYASLKNEAK